MAGGSRSVQGCKTSVVFGVNVSPSGDESLCGVNLAGHSCHVQWCDAVIVCCIYGCTCTVDECLDRFGTALEGRYMQGHRTILVPCVNVGRQRRRG